MASEQVVSSNLVGASIKKPRSSNLELYRIVCMLMIVAHHYAADFGIFASGNLLLVNPDCANSDFLRVFGAWGKTGINCFMMITGYYMCTSKITIRKFLKLLLQVYLYKLLLFPIFLYFGYESISPERLVRLLMPVWGFNNGFTSCFIVFYLTIPFLSILVHNMTKRQHELLILLLLTCYTILGSVPKFNITFNYVSWFGAIFFIASYIRLYPNAAFEKRKLWGWITLLSFVLACVSISVMHRLFGISNFFVADSNKIFAVAIAICSFLWFKNINIPYNKTINIIGASTFGVLLIHANPGVRTWLWRDALNITGHFSLSPILFVMFSIGAVLVVFIVCNLIDQIRVTTLEKWFFRWYDNKLSAKADAIIDRITSVRNG